MKVFTNKDLQGIPARLWCGIFAVLFSIIFAFTTDGLKYAVLCIAVGVLLLTSWFISFVGQVSEYLLEKEKKERKE